LCGHSGSGRLLGDPNLIDTEVFASPELFHAFRFCYETLLAALAGRAIRHDLTFEQRYGEGDCGGEEDAEDSGFHVAGGVVVC
jgi:hypothetical protein